MRRLVEIIGAVFVALGIICVLGGSMVPTVNPSADNVLWTGIVMILVGWLICYLARRKTDSAASWEVQSTYHANPWS